MRRFPHILILAATLAITASAADAKILITIDKSAQQMTVDVDGSTRWTWPVSTGRRGYLTPSGRFTAFRMEKDHFSKEWDDAPMPHSIFFTKQGHAIHGSYETKRLGSAASHGCVRLSPANAAKLYALVAQQGVTNATVVVAGGEPSAARPSRRNSSEEAPRDLQPRYERQAPSYYPSQSYPPPAYEPRPYYAPQPDYYRY
jgi:L,D-transpeptidase-like protein